MTSVGLNILKVEKVYSCHSLALEVSRTRSQEEGQEMKLAIIVAKSCNYAT